MMVNQPINPMRELILAIKGQFQLNPFDIHGIPHWARVRANGRKLASKTGANFKVVELFAVFHDSRRENDWEDPGHGLRGAELAREKRGDWFDVSDGEMDLLFHACAHHTGGRKHDDITVQTCWDSDRLDLGRVGITPDPKYLCTEFGKSAEIFQWAHSSRYGA
jgi:uncharacterized protein